MKVERRIVDAQLEVRSSGDEPVKLIGYAAVFDRDANIAGLFLERIAPGAFAAAVAEDDVRALFNHDPNFVLGRTAAGTLRLSEDETGLLYEVDPPDTQVARDLMVSVKRGDVNQSSFGFQVVRDEWLRAENAGDLPKRTILEARLFDVSPVTYPAYEETTAEARSQATALVSAAVMPAVVQAAPDEQALTDVRQRRQVFIEATL
jgi:HK97 family phage prohead protease